MEILLLKNKDKKIVMYSYHVVLLNKLIVFVDEL